VRRYKSGRLLCKRQQSTVLLYVFQFKLKKLASNRSLPYTICAMSKKNLKPNIKRARTCVYNCNYHIVFSTEYRRKVLTAEVEEYMKKGITARKLFLKFPQLKKKLLKGHLWNSSYYIETIGSISGKSVDLSDYKEQDVIKKYIENQKKI